MGIPRTIISKTGVDTSRILQSYLLSNSEIAELEISLNPHPIFDGNYQESECYVPRHGILFYNEQRELITYLEFCLECSVAYKWNQKKSKLPMDSSQWNYLIKLIDKKTE